MKRVCIGLGILLVTIPVIIYLTIVIRADKKRVETVHSIKVSDNVTFFHAPTVITNTVLHSDITNTWMVSSNYNSYSSITNMTIAHFIIYSNGYPPECIFPNGLADWTNTTAGMFFYKSTRIVKPARNFHLEFRDCNDTNAHWMYMSPDGGETHFDGYGYEYLLSAQWALKRKLMVEKAILDNLERNR